jgi:menaquinone-dependent protoporphyrinogen oxidase
MMTKKILVTYASRTGSTAGVAEEVGKTLRENEYDVDVLAMEQVEDISTYQAVVAGSAIQNRMWLPEAVEFMRQNQSDLAKKPVAMFSVCMTLAMKNGEQYRPQIAQWVSPVKRIVQPVSEGIFAGVLDISKIPSFGDKLKFRLSVLFGVWSEGDHRDWEKIRDWANQLRRHLE